MGKIILSLDAAVFSVFSYFALGNLLDYESKKEVVFENYLSRQSELTEEVIEAAEHYARGLVDFPALGLAEAAIAGMYALSLGYTLAKKKE